ARQTLITLSGKTPSKIFRGKILAHCCAAHMVPVATSEGRLCIGSFSRQCVYHPNHPEPTPTQTATFNPATGTGNQSCEVGVFYPYRPRNKNSVNISDQPVEED